MRLIDADMVKAKISNIYYKPHEVIGIINSRPTVEAIPVEWILKWACGFIDPNSEGYKMAMELVHDWRKDNEID